MKDEPQASANFNRNAVLAEIAALRQRFAEIIFSHNHAALPVLFTPDTILLPSGKRLVRGRDDVVAFWTAATSDPNRRLRSEFEAIDSLFEGEVVIESGRATVWVVNGEHEQLVDRGKYIVVWKREGGLWRRHRDIYNSDTERPGAPIKVGER